MSTIVYPVYGTSSKYKLELTHSVMSAYQKLRKVDGGVKIAILCERGNARPDLPVDHIFISSEQMRSWQMDGRYNHAIQAYALRHALHVTKGTVCLMDSDTVFHRSPGALTASVSPGCALMHADEGPANLSPEWSSWFASNANLLSNVSQGSITGNVHMLNAGVIGIDYADMYVCDEIIDLTEKLFSCTGVFTSVQLATSVVLQAHLKVGLCNEAVEHYWNGPREYYSYQFRRMYSLVEGDHDTLIHMDSYRRLNKDLPIPRLIKLRSKMMQATSDISPSVSAAYTRYLAALYYKETDIDLANVLAASALDLLMYGKGSNNLINRYFLYFNTEELRANKWMNEALRDRWVNYWKDESSFRA